MATSGPVSRRLFYSRLFEFAPRLQGHLLRDMDIQPARLAALVETAVAHLDQVESLHSALWVSGRRYACCDIRDEDYNTVAEAFLWTLKQALEDRFTPALQEAWANAYTTLATLTKDGAAQVQPPRLTRLRSLFRLRGVGRVGQPPRRTRRRLASERPNQRRDQHGRCAHK